MGCGGWVIDVLARNDGCDEKRKSNRSEQLQLFIPVIKVRGGVNWIRVYSSADSSSVSIPMPIYIAPVY